MPEFTLGDVLTALGGPWLDRARAQAASDAAAYQQGGVPALLADTQGGQELAGGFGGNIRAYHGSPYDFAKFSLAHIGTGEGAQAYGHGLYFAENPAVAETYKKMYVPNTTIAGRIGLAPAKVPEASPGRMYEVNINARPEQFLDWDKLIGEQPVWQQLNRLRADPYFSGEELYTDLARKLGGERQIGNPSYPVPFTNEAAATQQLAKEGIPGIRYLDQGSRNNATIFSKGGDQYGVMLPSGQEIPLSFNKASAEAEAARQNTFAKTSNYVVFNPDIVDILRKYGIAAPVAGATMADVLQGQQGSQ